MCHSFWCLLIHIHMLPLDIWKTGKFTEVMVIRSVHIRLFCPWVASQRHSNFLYIHIPRVFKLGLGLLLYESQLHVSWGLFVYSSAFLVFTILVTFQIITGGLYVTSLLLYDHDEIFTKFAFSATVNIVDSLI